MKTIVETHFANPFENDCLFYLLPTIWLNYEKDNWVHGRQFVITIGFLFWDIEIEFNEH